MMVSMISPFSSSTCFNTSGLVCCPSRQLVGSLLPLSLWFRSGLLHGQLRLWPSVQPRTGRHLLQIVFIVGPFFYLIDELRWNTIEAGGERLFAAEFAALAHSKLHLEVDTSLAVELFPVILIA